MPQLVVLIIKLAFLALLWLFVLAAIRTVRLDIFGPRVPRAARKASRERAAPPAVAPRGGKPKGRAPRELLVTAGALAGTRVRLDGSPITLGRDGGSTLVLTDDYVSNHHARIYSTGDRWLVEDLGSTNGTYLGDAKVTGPTPLNPGSPVRIGKTVVELRR
ncbi:MAG: FHA domain-containing protein [Mycobacteriales bacterium]